jgi:hypothetical protein
MAGDARGLVYFFLLHLNILWLEIPNIVVTLNFLLSLVIDIYASFRLIFDFVGKPQIQQTHVEV